MASTGERAERQAPAGVPRERPAVLARAAAHPRVEIVRAARRHGVLPYFRQLEGELGPVATMEGAERVMLGSNNYLGLTAHPRVRAGARDALDRYGTALTGSRLLNGTTRLHHELEQELSDWLGAEDALVFTTGHQASLGVVATLLGPDDTLVCDSSIHASILDGAALSSACVRRFGHNRLDLLVDALGQASGEVLVAVEGIYSMGGDLPDLPAMAGACRSAGSALLVDEAHAIGVLGEHGAGACREPGLAVDADLRIGTFSKALASTGGFVAGPADVIDFLRTAARAFVFTAAGTPAATGAALAAVRVARSSEGDELRARLAARTTQLRAGLARLGLSAGEPTGLTASPIVSVPVGEDWRAAQWWRALYDAGVYVNAAVHPAVAHGDALLRLSVMATHEPAHVECALEAFAATAPTECGP